LVDNDAGIIFFCLHTVHGRCRRGRVTRLQVNEVSIPSSLVNSCSPRASCLVLGTSTIRHYLRTSLGVCRGKDAPRRSRQRMEQRSFNLHLSEVDRGSSNEDSGMSFKILQNSTKTKISIPISVYFAASWDLPVFIIVVLIILRMDSHAYQAS